tara:strand:+ start:152 stop:310 length:159 start_codon:yes stop_codon:yes gene_type:complete
MLVFLIINTLENSSKNKAQIYIILTIIEQALICSSLRVLKKNAKEDPRKKFL